MAKAITFTDDFSSGANWTSSASAVVLVTGGQLKVTPTAGYDLIESNSSYDLTDSEFAVKLVQNANAGLGSISTFFRANVDSSNYFEFEIGGGASGAIILRERSGGVNSETSITYSASAHVWLRLREAGGTIYWETSADGAVWTVQRSKASALTLTSVSCLFGGGYWDAETTPGFALFDDLNPGGGIPKLETLQDDFVVEHTAWWTGFDGAIASVVDGQLNLSAATSDYYPPLETVDSYRLIGSYAAFQLVQNLPLGGGSYTVLFHLVVDSNNSVSFTIEGGNTYVSMTETVAGVNSTSTIAFNPFRFKWFRIREDAGTVYWETSIDGATWVVRRSKATTLNLSSVKARFSAGWYGSETGSPVAIIDNFNLNTGTAIGVDEPLSASLLTDDFTAQDDSKWFGFDSNVSVIGGQLKMVPANPDYAILNSYDHWDISESAFAVQFVQNNNAGTGSISFEFGARMDGNNSFRFVIWGGPAGKITLRETVAGVQSNIDITYNPVRHKYLRLRGSGGHIYWETSYNGVSWTIQRAKATVLDTSDMGVQLVCGHYDTEAAPGFVLLDNFNITDTSIADAIGWTVGGGLAFGALDGGTVQSKLFFQEADWLWEPIPDDPVLDPMSATWCSYLQSGSHGVSVWDYADTIVTADMITPETPRYVFTWTGPEKYPEWGFTGDPFEGRQVPVPLGTHVPPGSDGHLCVLDPVSGRVFSAWQAEYDEANDSWSASWGGISYLNGDGRDYLGTATAASLSRVCGVVLTNELVAGEIPHALFSASGSCGPGFRYPAQKSDGTNLAGVEHPVPQGVRIQLNPALDLASIPNITPAELAIGRAMQKYGTYLGDQGGGGTGFGCQLQHVWGPDYSGEYLETPAPYQQAGLQWDYWDMVHIPWAGNLRILKNWDGSA